VTPDTPKLKIGHEICTSAQRDLAMTNYCLVMNLDLSRDQQRPTRATFTAFSESTKADWDNIMVQLETTQARVADRIIEQLEYLRHDFGGFPVNRLEHCLQTATRAERDGRDEEYILCALVHDIGDNLSPYNHAAVAAAIVEPAVSKANHWLVAHHGIFQGYFFWQHIGLDPNTRENYRDSQYFDYTAEFCAKYDQVAFDPDYKSAPLSHFEPIIRKFFAPRDRTGETIN